MSAAPTVREFSRAQAGSVVVGRGGLERAAPVYACVGVALITLLSAASLVRSAGGVLYWEWALVGVEILGLFGTSALVLAALFWLTAKNLLEGRRHVYVVGDADVLFADGRGRHVVVPIATFGVRCDVSRAVVKRLGQRVRRKLYAAVHQRGGPPPPAEHVTRREEVRLLRAAFLRQNAGAVLCVGRPTRWGVLIASAGAVAFVLAFVPWLWGQQQCTGALDCAVTLGTLIFFGLAVAGVPVLSALYDQVLPAVRSVWIVGEAEVLFITHELHHEKLSVQELSDQLEHYPSRVSYVVRGVLEHHPLASIARLQELAASRAGKRSPPRDSAPFEMPPPQG